MTCVIQPDESVSTYFRALSATSPQVIRRLLHSAIRRKSAENPRFFNMFCTSFSSSIRVPIPWRFSAAFSHGFRRENGRKQGGDPKSAETAENRFRKAGSAGFSGGRKEICTQNVARGTFGN
jgi:hypothetical protein